MILGKNEIIGLEDVFQENDLSSYTVKCYSQGAKAYFIPKINFLHDIHSFGLDNYCNQELAIKTSINIQRMKQVRKGYKEVARVS